MTRSVHRLVLEAFVGPNPEGMVCRHLDGNPRNNHVGNLAWGTHVENGADQYTHGTRARGTRVRAAKLTEDDVRLIRESTDLSRALAVRFGVSKSAINRARHGHQWRHVS
jgi:hypothetical protein